MENKIFAVYHEYYVDGGFGDGVQKEDILFVTTDENVAKEFVEKNSNEHVYDIPYDSLTCGKLVYRELPTIVPKPYQLDFLSDSGWCTGNYVEDEGDGDFEDEELSDEQP